MVSITMNHEMTEDDVVISGFSGRFPMSDNIDELSENLFNKRDLVQPKEEYQWKNSKLYVPSHIGQINEKNKFDSGFFGIHRKHASSLDIMTRLILERSFEAIVDAGLNPNDLRKTNTGVLCNASISESENTWMYGDIHSGLEFLGHSRAMLSNRISFWLNTNATSFALTSMETGGIEAITLAYDSIKSGRFDAALIGSISVVLLPELSYHYKELGLVSSDGKTKSFDAAADGYARSDGVAVMLLQRAKDAKRVYATVVHSAAEIYGDRMTPLISPTREPFIHLLQKFYDKCGIDPSTIQFLEADGSGNKIGDEEELNAVDEVLLRNRKSPLLIGSIKSNLGHANAASNFFSIAKVLIAMQTGQIPPNIHYKQPSLNIPALHENRLKVVTEPTPWDGGLAAVNTIGMTGMYGHVLLRSFERSKRKHDDELPRLVVVSGRTQVGMEDLLYKLESIPLDVEFIRLLHDVHSTNISNHLFRAYTILPAGEKLFHEIQHVDSTKRPIWFVFSGMGSQWPGMGRELMKLPVCAETIEKCHAILAEKGLDLKHIITSNDPSVFDTILHCFVGITAIQLALVDALTLLGIVPDGFIGHSVGELGCAYADGCFTREQMLLAAYYRGKASIESDLIRGSMAAIGLSYNEVKNILPPDVDVACHNSAQSCTLSGPVESVTKFVNELKDKGVFARLVNVANIAYHSRYIKPAAPALLKSLKEIIPDPKLRSSRWACSSVPEEKWDTLLARYCSAEYHTNNLLSPVLFEEASRHIPKNAITIEVAPHGLLQAILNRSLDSECTNIALTQRNHPQGLHFLLAAIGKIYMTGPIPQVSKLYPEIEFPVSRGTPSIASLVHWDHSDSWNIVDDISIETVSGENDVTVSLSRAEDRILAEHVIDGRILYPTFAYLKIVWECLSRLQDTSYNKMPVMFEDVRILGPLDIPERGALHLYVMVQRGSGNFEICQGQTLLAKGRIVEPENIRKEYVGKLPALDVSRSITVNSDEFYGELEQRGYQYKGLFKGIQETKFCSGGCVAKVQWADDWITLGEALIQLMLMHLGEHNQSLLLPTAIQKVVINPSEFSSINKEFEVVYHHSMGVIRCGGLELRNMKTAPLEMSLLSRPKSKLKMETVKFLHHSNPGLQSVQQFVEMCVWLAIENCFRHVASTKMTVIELGSNQSFNPLTPGLISTVLSHYPQVNLKAVGYDVNEISNEDRHHCSLVVVADRSSFKQGLSLMQQGFLLVTMEERDVWPLDTSLVIVSQQVFGDTKLLLLRKSYQPNDLTTFILYPKGEVSLWLEQIRTAKPCERLYVMAEVSSDVLGKLSTFVKQVMMDSKLSHVRCVFLLSKSDEPFTIYGNKYKERLSLDLLTNIYHNGMWGSFHNIPLGYATKQPTVDLLLRSIQRIEDIKVQYLGLNLKHMDIHENDESQKEIGELEFSGKSIDGHCVMGIAQTADNILNNTKDQHLTWHVPNNWSLADAATVPLAYSMAYYALVLIARVEHGENVLIHAGWSSIGQAAIALALDYNCTVFTTAANQEQKNSIKRTFTKLPETHILSTDNFLCPLLMMTEGKGATVVLNTLTGQKLFTSLSCLGRRGRFVQLASNDLIKNTEIGMEMFLRNIAIYGVAKDSLFTMTPEWKEALQSGIQDGLQRGVVKPLNYSVFSREQAQQALRTLSNVQHIGKVLLTVPKDESPMLQQYKFHCDPHGFYLVAGGKAEQCVDMAEWLVLHGAHQLVISLQSKTVSNQVTRRIGLLRSYHGAQVILVSTPPVNTVSSAMNMLQIATSAMGGGLRAIFILPSEPTGQENGITATTVSNLDTASRSIDSLQHFVCLLSEGSWSTCESRHRAGLPALAIHWSYCLKKDFNFRQSLQILDSVLNSGNPDQIVVVSEENLVTGKREAYSGSSLDTFLPDSLEDLIAFGEDLARCSTCSLMEIPSLSPGKAYVKEVPPVFMIPGIQGPPEKVLKSLARRILFPVLCAKLPHSNMSLPQIATSLVKQIREIQKKGPYNLVGVSWGGVLTLELTRQFEEQGDETRVLLVDGAPETVQNLAELLNKGTIYEANLICRLLQINNSKLCEELVHLPDWSSRLHRGLSELPHQLNNKKLYLKRALTAVADRISTMLQYQFPDTLLSAEVTLVQPADGNENNCGLTQFFKQTVNICMVNGDHRTILNNRETANVINSFVS